MKKIVFFSSKTGVGKTTLLYHFSTMLAELGLRVLCADLDPQSGLSSLMLEADRLEEIYTLENGSVWSGIQALLRGGEQVAPVHIEEINQNLGLLTGCLELAALEEPLSECWHKGANGENSHFRLLAAFHSLLEQAAESFAADYVIVNTAANLGAINKTILMSCNYLMLPLTADVFSVQAIKSLGTAMQLWRQQWKDILKNKDCQEIVLPQGDIYPLGYVILRHGSWVNPLYRHYLKWIDYIPESYRQYICHQKDMGALRPEEDPNCLDIIRFYPALIEIAAEVKKPMFLLKPADGPIGRNYRAVTVVYKEYKSFASKVLSKIETLSVPERELEGR